MTRRLALLLGLAALIVALDQWTKYLVLRELTWRLDDSPTLSSRLGAMFSSVPTASGEGMHFAPKRAIEVWPGYLRLRYAENPGAAWGMFRTLPEKIRAPMFHLVSLGAIALISFYFVRLTGHPSERWARWGLPLVLGGALGNYVDRIARGFVIDYVEAHWHDQATWPSFNVADAAICVGVGMLVVDAFVRREHKSSPASVRL